MSRVSVLAPLLSGLLLAACSQSAAPTVQAYHPAYLAQVSTAEQTSQSLAAQYGAQVMSFDAATGLALLGFDHDPASQSQNAQSQKSQSQKSQTLSAQTLKSMKIERNVHSYLSSGRSTVWATGRAASRRWHSTAWGA
ncbi:hypothetical protein [Deinococcus sp.]|uniref:hypothetical protein n=1 Tax=Deinococcus sp. TaxID=47478 RepID=UPI0025E7736C|nr:hypothetical protein [Deinococcus sp.]